jgi:hypothetical protein
VVAEHLWRPPPHAKRTGSRIDLDFYILCRDDELAVSTEGRVMTRHTDDLVRVAAGSWGEILAWGDMLRGAGIEYQVVGDNLTDEPGTIPPGSVELWVHNADAVAAEAAVADRCRDRSDDTLPR